MAVKWPAGITSAGVPAGIKSGGELDLGLLVSDAPATWAGTFTQNAAAAAPVLWSKSKLSMPVRALVVNSGNANACTGKSGVLAVEQEAAAVADQIGCDADEVLIASTGTIGIPLPVDKILGALPTAAGSLDEDVDDFAHSILTTDTTVKVAEATIAGARVVGVAKGAAMLAPNMATMLAFLTTDASTDAGTLQKALDIAVEHSFNRISVDACESTNDSVFMFATGAGDEPGLDELVAATSQVCKELAEAMVRDAEGGSRVVRIRVTGAASDEAACGLARAVASSALWRAAVHGGDPNWGRVAAALGGADWSLDLAAVDIAINDVSVFDGGEPTTDLTAARVAMSSGDITIKCGVGDGSGAADFLTSDLSPEYVTLNAEGTT